METRISYVKKSYSLRGIISTILAITAIILLGIGLWNSYQTNGNGGLIATVFSFCAILVSLTGLFFGITSFFDEDSYYLFGKIGVVINGLITVGIVILIILGGS